MITRFTFLDVRLASRTIESTKKKQRYFIGSTSRPSFERIRADLLKRYRIRRHDHRPCREAAMQDLENFFELAKRHGLIVIQPGKAGEVAPLSIQDLVPTVRPFSGSYEQDGVSIDEWRIQMRLRLKQISLMDGPKIDEEFKANYILSMFRGWAFDQLKVKLIHKCPNSNPSAGYRNAAEALEKFCDFLRKRLEEKEEKAGPSENSVLSEKM